MESETPIDVDEGEWENGPTIDDIITNVMKTKSNFGKKKLSLPNIKRPSRIFNVAPEVEAVKENSTSETHYASAQSIADNKAPMKAHTEEIKSCMQQYNGQFGTAANTESVMDSSTCSSGYITQIGNSDIDAFRVKQEKENTSPQLSSTLLANTEKSLPPISGHPNKGSTELQEKGKCQEFGGESSQGSTIVTTTTTTLHQSQAAPNTLNPPQNAGCTAKSTTTSLLSAARDSQTIRRNELTDCTKPKTSTQLEAMDHISVNDQEYLKLSLLGKGGSSKVYEVLDLETKMLKAIKVVDIEGIDDATLNGYKNEIGILERLTWSDRVVRLYDYEQTPKTLKIIMERGNKDLSTILSSARGKRATLSPFTVKHYWQGMLLACQAIHKEGIVHSDLKPANFLLVNEMVKLIDFGIASSIQEDMTSVIKDSQSGTFNYMSPESLNDVHHGPIINGRAGDKPIIKIGVKSDVWSLGCILYNLVYGRTPFQHIANPIQKLAAISDSRTQISFPDIADKKLLDVIKKCLQFESRKRPSIEELLSHPYLNSGPLNQKETTSPPSAGPLSNTQREAMQTLAALSPNSLMKITSMMQQMKDTHK